MTDIPRCPVTVRRWIDTPDPPQWLPAVDAIFFDTAATKTFPSPEARAAFRGRWLGRYLEHDAGLVWLAISQGELAGYLVGCLEDPARTARFADIAYFTTFASTTARYPAHLHINLDARWRSAGVGSRLVAAFVSDVQAAGLPGVHVVTGAGMRNVGFYTRNGFAEVARTPWNGRDIVMLGRKLA